MFGVSRLYFKSFPKKMPKNKKIKGKKKENAKKICPKVLNI